MDLADPVFGEISLLGSQMATVSLCVHVVVSLCVPVADVSLCVPIFSS